MTFTPHTAFTERRGRHQRRRNDRAAVVALAERAKRVGSQAGCGGGQGGVAGWVGWRAGWDGWSGGWRAGSGGGQGRVAGLVRLRAGSGGGPGDRRGMDLQSKECSGVNIVT